MCVMAANGLSLLPSILQTLSAKSVKRLAEEITRTRNRLEAARKP
jgi:hypothetical protein